MLEEAVKNFFFLHYPTSRKIGKDKTVYKTNAQDALDAIGASGEKVFYENHPEYKPIAIPYCFLFVFNAFMEIRNHIFEVMTFKDIEAYCTMRNLKLTQTELDYMLKIDAWANEQIRKMQDEEK